jgi:hypothetical protein
MNGADVAAALGTIQRNLPAVVRQALDAAAPAERVELVAGVYLALRDCAPEELRAEEARARLAPEPAKRWER